jgi:hypothetical protein
MGDFRLEPADQGFTIETSRPVRLGRWDKQGLPFYPGNVIYEYEFSLARPTEAVAVSLPKWQGSVARVRIDGAYLGPIAWPPDRLAVEHALKPGAHTLAIEVSGNFKNMLGPHFNDGLPGIWSWSNCPATTPPGKRYRFYPSGLDEPPKLQIAPAGN